MNKQTSVIGFISPESIFSKILEVVIKNALSMFSPVLAEVSINRQFFSRAKASPSSNVITLLKKHHIIKLTLLEIKLYFACC